MSRGENHYTSTKKSKIAAQQHPFPPQVSGSSLLICFSFFTIYHVILNPSTQNMPFGSTGKYMYTEATPWSAGDNAKLQLVVPRSNSTSCLKFFYHMHGYGMGTLNVINGNTTIFTVSGDQGDYWKKVARTVNSSDVVNMPALLYKLVQTSILPRLGKTAIFILSKH